MGRTLKVVGRVWIALGVLPLVLVAGFGITNYPDVTKEIASLKLEEEAEQQRNHAAFKKELSYKDGITSEEKDSKSAYIAYGIMNKYSALLDEKYAGRREFVTSVKWYIGFSLGWLLIATTVGVLLLNQAEAKRTL
jgi:hypothetical protein